MVEQALEETRKEIQSSDIDLKSAAILKLIYVRCSRQSAPSPSC